MRNNSVICRILTLSIFIIILLVTNASASNNDSSAQALKDIGLFQGSDSGFDLDRAPTRTEAAVMLVRLLGAENTAKTQYASGKISNPFSDVEDWAKPYVAWLYKQNLTRGVSDTAFGASGQCTAKMYCTFVLRSLGYRDGENADFTFDEAVYAADYLGIYDSDSVGDTFLRDDVVVISYRALAANLKGSSTCLLQKLIADGAVSEIKAATLLDKVTVYHDYCEAYNDYSITSAASTITKRTLDLINNYNSSSYKLSEDISYSIIASEDDLQMSWIDNKKQGNDLIYQASWIKDGYYYFENDSKKIKMAITDDFLKNLFSGDSSSRLPSLDQVKSITKTSEYDGTKYVINYADNYDYFSYLNNSQYLGFDTSELISYSESNCKLTVLIGSSGLITAFKNDFACTFKYYFDGFLVPLTLYYADYETVYATGNNVSIKFPDFSGFSEAS